MPFKAADAGAAPENDDTFVLWATSDAHVVREAKAESCDPAAVPRESLRVALEQVEGPDGFHYDMGVQLGDLLDYDHETAENFRLYLEQLSHSTRDRHCWYHVGGNNDENSVLNDGVAIDNEHYRKTIDPVGEFTALSGTDNSRRPYPVTGTYERYHVDNGNLRLLFLSDRNDLPAPYGRGEGGFYVDGAVTLDTYRWLVDQVVRNPDRLVAVLCHHPLKDTTIGTGLDDSWKGRYMTNYDPERAKQPDKRLQTVLHQVYDVDPFDSTKFRTLLGQNHGMVDLWMAGHVHHRVEERFEGRGKYAAAFGGHHFNVGTLCRYRHHSNIISAQGTRFTFTAGSPEVESAVWVHDHPTFPPGFYAPEHRRLALKRAFEETYSPPPVSSPSENVRNAVAESVGQQGVRLAWENPNTGVLIVRAGGAACDFRPEDDHTYYVGQPAGNGEVVFMGTASRCTDTAGRSGAAPVYSAFAYRAGGGSIKYHAGAPLALACDAGTAL